MSSKVTSTPLFMAQVRVQVPEAALLHVFRWLPPLELLRGPRGVCRAWRQAALHPSLWQHHSLRSGCPRRELLATLRIAPCLRALALTSDVFPAKRSGKPLDWEAPVNEIFGALMLQMVSPTDGHREVESVAPVLEATNCYVTELQLQFDLSLIYPDVTADRKLLSILHRQVELGHLKVLDLKMVQAAIAEDAIRSVLEADLTTLRFQWKEAVQLAALPEGLPDLPRSPRLKSLHYETRTDSSRDAFLEHLLKTHAASLESVTLTTQAPRRAVKLLASCPKLRAVEVLAEWREANGLSRCGQLESLALRVQHDRPPPLHDLFRSGVAAQLTQLSFRTVSPGPVEKWAGYVKGPGDVLELVTTLSASGRSLLRELNLCVMKGVRLERSWLSGVLRGLPQLAALRAQNPITEDAMECISPASAPSLRLLQFASIRPVEHECGELHCSYMQSACRLVLRNPQLHVMGLLARHQCCGGEDPLGMRCRWLPAPPPEGAEQEEDHEDTTPSCRRVSLYGHRDEELCGVPEHSSEPVSKYEPPSCFRNSLYGFEDFVISKYEDGEDTIICESYDNLHEWLSVQS